MGPSTALLRDSSMEKQEQRSKDMMMLYISLTIYIYLLDVVMDMCAVLCCLRVVHLHVDVCRIIKIIRKMGDGRNRMKSGEEGGERKAFAWLIFQDARPHHQQTRCIDLERYITAAAAAALSSVWTKSTLPPPPNHPQQHKVARRLWMVRFLLQP